MCADALRRESESGILNFEISGQKSLLPLLQIAHKAIPRAASTLQEVLLILHRLGRFLKKHLDESTILSLTLAEMQPRLDNPSVVEHHQSTLRQQRRQRTELRMADATTIADKQFAAVAPEATGTWQCARRAKDSRNRVSESVSFP